MGFHCFPGWAIGLRVDQSFSSAETAVEIGTRQSQLAFALHLGRYWLTGVFPLLPIEQAGDHEMGLRQAGIADLLGLCDRFAPLCPPHFESPITQPSICHASEHRVGSYLVYSEQLRLQNRLVSSLWRGRCRNPRGRIQNA